MAMTSSPSDHKATMMDGKATAQTIRSEISNEFLGSLPEIRQGSGSVCAVIVGNRKDCRSYVSMKRKACAEDGIKSFYLDLPEDVYQDDVLAPNRKYMVEVHFHYHLVLSVDDFIV